MEAEAGQGLAGQGVAAEGGEAQHQMEQPQGIGGVGEEGKEMEQDAGYSGSTRRTGAGWIDGEQLVELASSSASKGIDLAVATAQPGAFAASDVEAIPSAAVLDPGAAAAVTSWRSSSTAHAASCGAEGAASPSAAAEAPSLRAAAASFDVIEVDDRHDSGGGRSEGESGGSFEDPEGAAAALGDLGPWIPADGKEQAATEKRLARKYGGMSGDELGLARLNHEEDMYREARDVEGKKQKRWKGRCGTCGCIGPIDVRFPFNKCSNFCKRTRKMSRRQE